jgi:hypothetical protein
MYPNQRLRGKNTQDYTQGIAKEVNIRTEVDEIEKKNKIQRISMAKSCF